MDWLLFVIHWVAIGTLSRQRNGEVPAGGEVWTVPATPAWTSSAFLLQTTGGGWLARKEVDKHPPVSSKL